MKRYTSLLLMIFCNMYAAQTSFFSDVFDETAMRSLNRPVDIARDPIALSLIQPRTPAVQEQLDKKLITAATAGNPRAVRALLALRADVNARDQRRLVCIRQSNFRAVRGYALHGDILRMTAGPHEIKEGEQSELLKRAALRGIKDMICGDIHGTTPLLWSTGKLSLNRQVTDLLLLHKADPLIADDRGCSPFGDVVSDLHDLRWDEQGLALAESYALAMIDKSTDIKRLTQRYAHARKNSGQGLQWPSVAGQKAYRVQSALLDKVAQCEESMVRLEHMVRMLHCSLFGENAQRAEQLALQLIAEAHNEDNPALWKAFADGCQTGDDSDSRLARIQHALLAKSEGNEGYKQLLGSLGGIAPGEQKDDEECHV